MRNKLLLILLIVSFILVACTDNNTQLQHHESKEVHISSPHPWSYEGKTGPHYWGELDPSYSLCSEGKQQSPISINFAHENSSTKIQIHYKPTIITIENDSRTILANIKEKNSSITIDGNRYILEQFHFHTPSEHQLKETHYPMELHLVHKDKAGKIAVIGILIQEGEENRTLHPIWSILPEEQKVTSLEETIILPELLPENKTSFLYNGSLTTPPCTEGVQWIVLENPIEMSKEQIIKFQEILPKNYRPVQPLNDRSISKTKITT